SRSGVAAEVEAVDVVEIVDVAVAAAVGDVGDPTVGRAAAHDHNSVMLVVLGVDMVPHVGARMGARRSSYFDVYHIGYVDGDYGVDAEDADDAVTVTVVVVVGMNDDGTLDDVECVMAKVVSAGDSVEHDLDGSIHHDWWAHLPRIGVVACPGYGSRMALVGDNAAVVERTRVAMAAHGTDDSPYFAVWMGVFGGSLVVSMQAYLLLVPLQMVVHAWKML
ncbi:hypothetical protein BGZ65_001702, partial [Modicella reniformis]